MPNAWPKSAAVAAHRPRARIAADNIHQLLLLRRWNGDFAFDSWEKKEQECLGELYEE